MSSLLSEAPVPSTLTVTIKTADGQELPAKIHWRDPAALIEMIAYTKENTPGPRVIVSENAKFDAEDFQAGVGDRGNPLFGGKPVVIAKRLPVTRLSATIEIDIPVAGEPEELPWPERQQG